MGIDEEDPIGQDFLMALTIATCGILLSSLPCVCISQEDSRCKGKTVEEPLNKECYSMLCLMKPAFP